MFPQQHSTNRGIFSLLRRALLLGDGDGGYQQSPISCLALAPRLSETKKTSESDLSLRRWRQSTVLLSLTTSNTGPSFLQPIVCPWVRDFDGMLNAWQWTKKSWDSLVSGSWAAERHRYISLSLLYSQLCLLSMFWLEWACVVRWTPVDSWKLLNSPSVRLSDGWSVLCR